MGLKNMFEQILEDDNTGNAINDSNSALDIQVGGDHYRALKIQPVEFIEANGLGFLEGNVIKYLSRHANKNGKDDLLKARHYIDLLIKFRYGDK